MTLRIYNTLTRQKEDFKPIDSTHVKMYVCGPTVYDSAHLGNARPVVVFDVLYRLLTHLYPKVTYARNITDVDDKIIKAAKKNNESIDTLTKRTTDKYHQDMAALNALSPDIEPRATQHIQQMIDIIKILIDKGHAYAAEGHVLFSVKTDPNYGTLSGFDKDQIISGARVEVAPYKNDPEDFILWKPSTDAMPGWGSPWGFGRPGWHIECSAMAKAYLGETFDIHGGGIDLVFPHHENEIAQSSCCNDGKKLANYWMHNGHLGVNGEKMSKSLGNFFTVSEKLSEIPGEVIRYVLLATHYRQPLDWTGDVAGQAKNILDKFYNALDGNERQVVGINSGLLESLQDDLNIPLALSHLHELVSEIHKTGDADQKNKLQNELRVSANLLGLLYQDPHQWFKSAQGQAIEAGEIEALIQQRRQARADKDFALADKIRDELTAKGVVLLDSSDGTAWRYK